MELPFASLPPELILHILSFLPVRSLLNFSLTSRAMHALAVSSMQTLSLGIYPSRMASVISQISATLPATAPPGAVKSSFATSRSTTSSPAPETEDELSASLANHIHAVNVIIPNAHSHDYNTLLGFQTGLMASILNRYRFSLRHLDVHVWVLLPPIAQALADIRSLRTLSLRIEDPAARFSSRRPPPGGSKLGSEIAWTTLAGAWKNLRALHIEASEMTTDHLIGLLSENRGLRELWLRKCYRVGNDIWAYLGRQWDGRDQLEILGVGNFRGEIGVNALDAISGVNSLKYLSLMGSRSVDVEALEEANKTRWRIPELILPKPVSVDPSQVIEIDPAYAD